jgi:CDP-diacylglycerol--glycerol-3-phosphate 3-phosphatidyltransferase
MTPKQLLNAARGSFTKSKSLLRYFPLHKEHFRLDCTGFSPTEFHGHLCDKILNAKQRVHLAALYIGPAADPSLHKREVELLDALKTTECPDVQILLDKGRALRPVPTPTSSFITSAEACHRSINTNNAHSKLFLFSVLPKWLQSILKNPYDEVSGVFHMKCYIIDDEMILSGANLSEEYFSDRIDRYLCIQNGGNGLVEFYADVFKVLSQHSYTYDPGSRNSLTAPSSPSRKDLIRSLSKLFTVPQDSDPVNSVGTSSSSNAVAFAVPTFQAPRHFCKCLSRKEYMPLDVDVLQSFLSIVHRLYPDDVTLRMSSAYLNLTNGLRRVLGKSHLLTAGRISHGFKPKKKAGNKGREWIPTVYAQLARRTAQHSSIWFYQREGWTYHAKGIWLTRGEIDKRFSIPDASSLIATVHGSGNYGGRSTYKDVESNMLLVYNDASDDSMEVKAAFTDEWNRFESFAQPPEKEEVRKAPWHVRSILPFCRSFF